MQVSLQSYCKSQKKYLLLNALQVLLTLDVGNSLLLNLVELLLHLIVFQLQHLDSVTEDVGFRVSVLPLPLDLDELQANRFVLLSFTVMVLKLRAGL